jgi:hypothetical protein
MSKRPFIAESKDGWSPSSGTIQRLQSKARKIGLIWDWPTIAVLANHDMLLDCSHITGDCGADLIACKVKVEIQSRWRLRSGRISPACASKELNMGSRAEIVRRILLVILFGTMAASNYFWRKAYETKPFMQKEAMAPWDIQYETDYDAVIRGWSITGDCLIDLSKGATRVLGANNDFFGGKGKPCRMSPNGRKKYVSVPAR